jgi:hypothetical protein
MRSLRSRAVADAGTATVLQPTQPGSTVTRTHLQGKGTSVTTGEGERPIRPARVLGPHAARAQPGPELPVLHGGSPRAPGSRPPPTPAPAHNRPRRPERPGADIQGGPLMAQARAEVETQEEARAAEEEQRRRRAPGPPGPCRSRPRARARPPGPLAEEPLCPRHNATPPRSHAPANATVL